MQIKNTNKNGDDIPVYVFKYVSNDKAYYKIGLSKKDFKGNYINGYVMAIFNKDVEIHNKTKIILKNAILDFYIKDKQTIPYIRVFDYELYGDNEGEFVTISDEELLF